MKDSDSNLPAITSPDTGRALRGLFADQGGVRGVFSSKVTDYMASRPGYPATLYDALHNLGALPAVPSVVADIGAGTGLFSEGLLARGHRVVAVEPNAAMRAAADHLLRAYEGYRSLDGSAEATTLGTVRSI
jgi:SAM-dependent methyltransferase